MGGWGTAQSALPSDWQKCLYQPNGNAGQAVPFPGLIFSWVWCLASGVEQMTADVNVEADPQLRSLGTAQTAWPSASLQCICQSEFGQFLNYKVGFREKPNDNAGQAVPFYCWSPHGITLVLCQICMTICLITMYISVRWSCNTGSSLTCLISSWVWYLAIISSHCPGTGYWSSSCQITLTVCLCQDLRKDTPSE